MQAEQKLADSCSSLLRTATRLQFDKTRSVAQSRALVKYTWFYGREIHYQTLEYIA